MLEADPEDSAHKLFVALTQQTKRSILTIMNIDRAGLKDLKHTGAEGNTFSFDEWEVQCCPALQKNAQYFFLSNFDGS